MLYDEYGDEVLTDPMPLSKSQPTASSPRAAVVNDWTITLDEPGHVPINLNPRPLVQRDRRGCEILQQ